MVKMDKYSQDLGNYQREVNKLFKTMNALNFNSLEDFEHLEDSEDEMEIMHDEGEVQDDKFEKKIRKAANKLGKKD
jgi:hypothetical protein